MQDEIGLRQAIELVKTELAASVEHQTGDIQFPVDAVELEFQVALKKSGEAGGKLRAWVLEFGATGAVEKADTHTIRVNLGAPRDAEGEVIKVNRSSDVMP